MASEDRAEPLAFQLAAVLNAVATEILRSPVIAHSGGATVSLPDRSSRANLALPQLRLELAEMVGRTGIPLTQLLRLYSVRPLSPSTDAPLPMPVPELRVSRARVQAMDHTHLRRYLCVATLMYVQLVTVHRDTAHCSLSMRQLHAICEQYGVPDVDRNLSSELKTAGLIVTGPKRQLSVHLEHRPRHGPPSDLSPRGRELCVEAVRMLLLLT